jgi:hypothetical protein
MVGWGGTNCEYYVGNSLSLSPTIPLLSPSPSPSLSPLPSPSSLSLTRQIGSFVDAFITQNNDYSPITDSEANGWTNGEAMYDADNVAINNGLTLTITNSGCPSGEREREGRERERKREREEEEKRSRGEANGWTNGEAMYDADNVAINDALTPTITNSGCPSGMRGREEREKRERRGREEEEKRERRGREEERGEANGEAMHDADYVAISNGFTLTITNSGCPSGEREERGG